MLLNPLGHTRYHCIFLPTHLPSEGKIGPRLEFVDVITMCITNSTSYDKSPQNLSGSHPLFISRGFHFFLDLGLSDHLLSCQVFDTLKTFIVGIVPWWVIPEPSHCITKNGSPVNVLKQRNHKVSYLLFYFLKDDSDSCAKNGLTGDRICEEGRPFKRPLQETR